MNQKTAKLIKQWSKLLNRPYRQGKKTWDEATPYEKEEARKRMESFVNPPKFEEAKN